MEGEGQQIAVTVPLFLRKLWKMVNDQEAEDIIGWNSTGDGFVIYDQLQFITKLLPKYFKHNNMASFIRQLNFYDFHKVAGLEKDVMQFSHACFLKDLPETLVFIRRKCASLRSRLTSNVKEEEVSEILSGVKELKTKHSLVDSELKQLKQENAALWNEVNNLRLKHAKQTKIINKIIHFLISYMHSHQNSLSKGKVPVGRRGSQNGPTILEIGYHDVEEDDDKQKCFTEPGHSGAITYPSSEHDTDSFTNMQPAERTLDEIINKVDTYGGKTKQHIIKAADKNKQDIIKVPKAEILTPDMSPQNVKPQIVIDSKPGTYKSTSEVDSLHNVETKVLEPAKLETKPQLSLYNPTTKRKQLPAQKPVKFNILQNPKENLGLYLSDTEVELNSLQDLLNNLNSSELTNFCNIIEHSEVENSSEEKNDANVANVCQEVDIGPAKQPEGDWVEKNDDSLSLAEDFTNTPVESSTIDINELPLIDNIEAGEYTVEDFSDLDPGVLGDSYFTT